MTNLLTRQYCQRVPWLSGSCLVQVLLQPVLCTLSLHVRCDTLVVCLGGALLLKQQLPATKKRGRLHKNLLGRKARP